MNRRKKRFCLLILGLTGLAALFRFFRLDAALEYDEIWTLENYASASLKVIFTELALPNNHPLNSLAVKLTAFSGGAPQWIRLVPFLAGVLAVPLAGAAAFGLWKRRSAALWSMFFVAVLPQAVFYSQQARGYSLQLFFLLVFTAGLFAARRRPVAGCAGILLGAAGAMLTLPTSAFYLAAIGSAGLYRCRKDYRNRLPAAFSLAAAGAGSLIWVLVNLKSFEANRSWGSPIDSFGDLFSFLIDTAGQNLPYPVLFGALTALLLGFRRSRPLLWLWGCLTVSAVAFNAGPPRTYLPLAAATALTAGYGIDLLLRRFPGSRKYLAACFVLAALAALAAAYRQPYPDWYAIHRTIRELPPEITVVFPANDSNPLAWNNAPGSYREQLRRIAPLPPGHAERKLLVVSRDGSMTGSTSSGAETKIPLSVPGIPVELDAMHGMLYGLEKLDGPPAAGTPFLAFIRPLPEPEAKKLLRILSAGQECLFLNFWLCTPVTENDILYRYYLAGGIAGEPEKTGWDAFLHEKPGATALYRIVPAGKSR